MTASVGPYYQGYLAAYQSSAYIFGAAVRNAPRVPPEFSQSAREAWDAGVMDRAEDRTYRVRTQRCFILNKLI